ncbi:MAG: DUF6514 family protein [Oscillospiraceae bacterium]|jgi:hypothetical protein|nr:DUF6514 family protein [Oscillospiraceae bacterium]
MKRQTNGVPHYFYVAHKSIDDYGRERKTYGICAVLAQRGQPKPIAVVRDVHASKAMAMQLVALLNQNKVALVHFNEVVEEWIAENPH